LALLLQWGKILKSTGKDLNASQAVNKNLATPLYHQIYLILHDEIISGQRGYGSLVPTEQELSRIYDVSRITARRALDELAAHKLVARRRRIGTQVIFESPAKPIEGSIDQALETLLFLGRNTKVKLLTIGEEEAPPSIQEALRLAPGDRVIRAVRVRWLDREPLGYVVSYVPVRLGVHLTAAALKSKPMLALLSDAGFKIGGANQTISAISADATLAKELAIEIRAPLLRISRTVMDNHGNAILLTMAHYRSDRYQIRLDLNPDQRRRAASLHAAIPASTKS
jgi:GntR family transcriptional regulator